MEENKKRAIILTIVAVSCLLVVVFGAAYAYFQVLSSSNVTGTNTQGQTDTMLKGTLVTNKDAALLKINLDAKLMSEENANTTYYATPSGTPVTVATEGSGKYVLATASLDKEGLVYDCTYSYRVSTTRPPKEIKDGSDADVKVTIIGSNGYEETYTLAQLLAGEEIYTGKIKGLTYGENQKIYVEAYVKNTNKAQDDLAGNEFTFTLALVENSFKCDLPISEQAKGKDFAQFLVDNNTKVDGLWNSGLEGDGYRYAGTGILCSYDNGNFLTDANNQYTTPSCPTLYNYTKRDIHGSTTNYTYETSCPSDDDYYTYTCTELSGTIIESSKNTVPNNFICFGTSDKTECKNNEAKYMYRIIGVFPDSSGTQHVKLISFKQLGTYAWHSDRNTDVAWENSDMYTGLNGEYFLINTTYDYLQNNTWLNKIEDWTWSAVNTKTDSHGGPSYCYITTQEIYLHEMNRSSKSSSIGEWSTPTAKIGLMYVSDYTLSLGDSALSMRGSTYYHRATLKTGWMHPNNNDTTSSIDEWTLSRYGDDIGGLYAWSVYSDGDVSSYGIVDDTYGVRPVFHLTSDASINGGNGEYENPYILAE